jgi:hypothetical protein
MHVLGTYNMNTSLCRSLDCHANRTPVKSSDFLSLARYRSCSFTYVGIIRSTDGAML